MVCVVRDGDFSYIVPPLDRWDETIFMRESAVNTFILKETETMLETSTLFYFNQQQSQQMHWAALSSEITLN